MLDAIAVIGYMFQYGLNTSKYKDISCIENEIFGAISVWLIQLQLQYCNKIAGSKQQNSSLNLPIHNLLSLLITAYFSIFQTQTRVQKRWQRRGFA